MPIDDRLQELGIRLPSTAPPVGLYQPAVRSGDLLYVSGQLPVADGAFVASGRLGAEVDLAAGQAAARQCAINCLAAAAGALGSLDQVRRVVRLTGYVASTGDFTQQPQVINGFSDLMVAVFGEAGRHARVAYGAGSLPGGAAVEVESLFEVR
jgi:enamine deaminase RidA (YjgF/YER057c/UK114 family)